MVLLGMAIGDLSVDLPTYREYMIKHMPPTRTDVCRTSANLGYSVEGFQDDATCCDWAGL